MYVINTATRLRIKNYYVSIRNILGDKDDIIIPKDTLVQVDYIFEVFNEISFRYPNGELVKQDLKFNELDSAFRIPYINEFKLTRENNGKE